MKALSEPNLTTYHYEYDQNGNRTTVEIKDDGLTLESTVYAYDRLNKLVSSREVTASGLYLYEYTYDDNGNLISEDRHRAYELNTNQWTNIRRYEYTKDNKLESVYSGNTLLVAYTYDGDGTITSSLERDLDLNQNLNIHDTNYINSLTTNQRQLINKVSNNDIFLYELTEYVTDKNRPYSETLMERDGTGQLSTIYTYGNQRINSESYNNLSGLYTYDGRGSVSAVIGSYGDFRASYWYDGLGNVKSQIHGYGSFGSGKKYYGYNAEQYNPVTGNQNLRNRQVNIRRQRFLSEDIYLGSFTETLSINRYIYGNDNPLKYKDPSGFAPVIIPNQNIKPGSKEPYILRKDDKEYFIRNGAEPVFSKDGNNYYATSGKIEVKDKLSSMIPDVTSISAMGYQDPSPYAEENIYQITRQFIKEIDPNVEFTHTKTPMFTSKLIGGIGIGGSVSFIGEVEAEAKYAVEIPLFSKEDSSVVMSAGVDAFSIVGLKVKYEELEKYSIFYDKNPNGKFSLGADLSGLGVEFSRDYLKHKTNIEYSFFDIPFMTEEDIKIPIGYEIYALAGVGFKAEINISEIMRRVDKMFDRPCLK